MKRNFLKTITRSKYVLGISAVAFMGAVMMSTNGNCMAMMSSDEPEAKEGSSASVVEKHRDVPVSECSGTTTNEDHSDAPEAKKSDDAPKSEEHDDVPKAEKRESTEIKISKAEAINGIRYALNLIKDNHSFADEKNFEEILKQVELEIAALGDEVFVSDQRNILLGIASKLYMKKENVLEDIESVLNLIQDRHVSAIEKIPDEVRDQFELEIANLGDRVTCIDEWRIISRILSKLHDAHSVIDPPGFLLNKSLSIATEYRDGKFVCTDGDNVGYEIEAINGISLRDLYKIFQEHYSYELEEWTEYNFFEDPADFIPEWKLVLCGIDTTKPIELNLKKGDNRKVLRVDLVEMPEPEKEPWISYDFDTENSIGYYRLDECNVSKEFENRMKLEQGKCDFDVSGISEIVEKDEYAKSLYDFFSGVKKKGIKNIIVDLRKNHGGNNLVAGLFIFYLAKLKEDYKTLFYVERKGDKIEIHDRDKTLDMLTMTLRENLPLFDGKVYVLTSHGTFSSGVDFALLLSDNKLATIVGEAPGMAVTCFGDITDVERTPNFGLGFWTSFKRFERPDPAKDKDRLIPDVQIPAKDALAKVYKLIAAEKKSQ